MNKQVLEIFINIFTGILIFIIVRIILGSNFGSLDTRYKNISLFSGETNYAFNLITKILLPNILFLIFYGVYQNVYPGLLSGSILSMITYLLVDYFSFRKIRMIQNNSIILVSSLLTFILSFFVKKNFIDNLETIFPSLEDLLVEFWLVIIGYLCFLVYKYIQRKAAYSNFIIDEKVEEYVINRYIEFKDKYMHIINENLNLGVFYEGHGIEVEELFFSIMIVEDFNRNFITRVLEYVWFILHLGKKEMTLGIMQVKSKKIINNNESVKLACIKVNEANEMSNNELSTVIHQYNSGSNYYASIIETADRIKEYNSTSMKSQM